MKFSRRILACFVALVTGVVLVLSLVVAAGVWFIREPVTTRTTRLFGRIEAALDLASRGLARVKTSLVNAEERLAGVQEEQKKLARGPQKNDLAMKMLARTVQQKISPEVGNARDTLLTISEAAVVVNSVLEDVGQLPFVSARGLDRDQLAEINTRLGEAASSVQELSRVLDNPNASPDAAVETQTSRTEMVLKSIEQLVNEHEPRLELARQEAAELKPRLLGAITPATVIISFLGFWIALSQVSLIGRACSWWKR
jgi:hypothetical protein